jgi:hypothetical protein
LSARLTIEPKLQPDARELGIDCATDYVFAALAFLIDHAPERVLIFERADLRCDWHRRLLIEITESQVRFSFPDNAGLQ